MVAPPPWVKSKCRSGSLGSITTVSGDSGASGGIVGDGGWLDGGGKGGGQHSDL